MKQRSYEKQDFNVFQYIDLDISKILIAMNYCNENRLLHIARSIYNLK